MRLPRVDNKIIWTRCGRTPVERHHRLTRARGGKILDAWGEHYHLMDLCAKHHRMADGKEAYDTGLLLDGYVTTNPDGSPHYQGTDPYLLNRYGRTPDGQDRHEQEAPQFGRDMHLWEAELHHPKGSQERQQGDPPR